MSIKLNDNRSEVPHDAVQPIMQKILELSGQEARNKYKHWPLWVLVQCSQNARFKPSNTKDITQAVNKLQEMGLVTGGKQDGSLTMHDKERAVIKIAVKVSNTYQVRITCPETGIQLIPKKK